MAGDLVAQLEAAAARRYVRWDAALWRRIVDGPARDLAESLRASGTAPAQAEAVLEAYLRLACEGVGLGYLFPPDVGESVFTVAWLELLPRALAAQPHERRPRLIAECWNLGENLEHAPLWLRRVFLRLLRLDGGLGNLEALVARVSLEATGMPSFGLGPRPRLVWVDLGHEDRSFLPGALHFAAPTVLCVHDRLRDGSDGTKPASTGVWLIDPPLPLGPMGCAETPGPCSDRIDLVDEAARRDGRAGDVLNCAANAWRAGLTLETSQFLVALLPS
jgi:hypothetical protein